MQRNRTNSLATLALLIAPSLCLSQGIITTVAGNGTNDSTGDGGPAINASLKPNGVTVDSQGNIYIADVGKTIIRKEDKTGIITTVPGFIEQTTLFSPPCRTA